MQSSRRNEMCTKCGIDSEKLYNCSRCKSAVTRYCGRKCQEEHWPAHKPICTPLKQDEVWGIKIPPNASGRLLGIGGSRGENDPGRLFEHVLIKADHHVFSMRGELCPVTQLVGLPLLVYSEAFATGVGLDANNQATVYLRIEPENGLAPLHWQMNGPGTCIVVRQDRRPLTRQAIEAMWQFTAKLIDGFGYARDSDCGWAPVQSVMTPASWQIFSRDYYQQQREKGRVGFDKFWEPL
ncbi:ectomycorrhiza-upregulated zf-MYND domain-containing protein [Heliocybe sulcata]|uniref:Ectomycorrhiza-upregulated zf-MYND domain-containing protein n=1 Tax=Heliocybe sulcata TaxID=5364 RepID=A0A5C3NIR0_9AGAM|nr:ectomycorrhiza-upregulated zf-MYND domain-containing protein [Heliocybe sulcata]